MVDLSGLDVKCPQCKRVYFKTTDKFDPAVQPNGAMVRSLLKYQIDWLCTKTTQASEMTCPECLGQLAHSGALLVMVPLNLVAEVSQLMMVPMATKPSPTATGESRFDAARNTCGPITPPQAPAKTFSFKCPVCAKEAKSARGLKSHVRMSHNDKK